MEREAILYLKETILMRIQGLQQPLILHLPHEVSEVHLRMVVLSLNLFTII